jgi:hypothetical protein
MKLPLFLLSMTRMLLPLFLRSLLLSLKRMLMFLQPQSIYQLYTFQKRI